MVEEKQAFISEKDVEVQDHLNNLLSKLGYHLRIA